MGGAQSSQRQKITSQDRAILDLKVQRDKLKQYQKRLHLSLDAEQRAAKQALVDGQKSRALTALRQRKHHESLLAKTDAQLLTLTELLSTIEYAQVQNQVLASLSVGADVLAELQNEMSLQRAEGIMDRVGQGVAAQREIDEALVSTLSPEEEESIERELAALQVSAMPAVPDERERVRLPDVPAHQPAGEEEEGKAERQQQQQRQQQREEDLRVAMAA